MAELWTLKHNLRYKIALYDADLLSYNDGDPIDTCTDATLEGNDLTATFGSRPTYRANYINGHAVMDFDGVGNQLTTASHAAYALGSFSWVFLVNPTAVGATRRFLWDTQTGRLICLVSHETDSNYRFYDGSYDSFGVSTTGWQLLIFTASLLAGATALYKNGTLLGNGSYTPRAINANVALGAQNGGGAYRFTGQMALACVVAGALSTTNRQLIEGALMHRIGLGASLPGGHPYLASPPEIGAWRSVLGWSQDELVRAAKLYALSRAHGRTRVLGESPEGVSYTSASLPLRLHVDRIRSGRVTWTFNTDGTWAGNVTCSIKRVSDGVTVGSAVAVIGAIQAYTVTVAGPTDQALYLDIDITGVSTGSAQIQDIQVAETPGAPSLPSPAYVNAYLGPFNGIDDGDYYVGPPDYVWTHGEDADSADFNQQIATLPKSALLCRSPNGASYTDGTTTLVEKFHFYVDKLLGSYLYLIAFLSTNIGTNAATLEITYTDGVTENVLGLVTTTSTTPIVVRMGGAVPAAALGTPITIRVRLAAGTGEIATASSFRIYSGESASTGDYLS